MQQNGYVTVILTGCFSTNGICCASNKRTTAAAAAAAACARDLLKLAAEFLVLV